jgi:hypothetical protein
MAGNRQHILPRFLQRGFCINPKNKKCFVYRFSKDKKDPVYVSISNNGLQKKYYTEENDYAIDNLITDVEPNIALYINNLRAITINSEIDSKKCAEIMVHLMVRSNYIRDTLLDSFPKLFEEIKQRTITKQLYLQFLIEGIQANPKVIKNSFYHILPISLSQKEKDIYINSIIQNTNNLTHILLSNIDQSFDAHHREIDNFIARKALIVKKAHLDAISKTISNKALHEKYINFNWSVQIEKNNSFILGDIGPISYVDKESIYLPSFFSSLDDTTKIYLPISNTHIIVGEKTNANNSILVNEINEAIALCCHNYFISSLEDRMKLKKLIGINKDIYFNNAIKNALLGSIF